MNLSSALQNVIKLLEMTWGVWHAKATKDPWHSKTPVFAGNVPLDNTEYKRLLELREHVKIHHPIWIYWSESNSLNYFIYIYLNKNWKMYWSKFYCSWARGPVFIVTTDGDKFIPWFFRGFTIYICYKYYHT